MDATYRGVATGTLAVARADAGVFLGDLSQVYDGTARVASATTLPAGLVVEFTYEGATNAPVNAGTYAVTGTVNEANWHGSATGTLTVGRADAEVFLLYLAQVYDGTARAASATTLPAGLVVEITYDGSTNAPVNAGSYAITGRVDEANGQGSATGTLVVEKAKQAIAFGALAAQRTNAVATLSATGGSSGQPVTFAVVAGPGVLAGGTNLSFTGVGDVQVVASQAGDGNFEAAPGVTNLVRVFDVMPDRGPNGGGNEVLVTNGNFGAITNVRVGVFDVPAFDQTSGSGFTLTLPAGGVTGAVDVVVQTEADGEITLPGAYTYNPAGEITGVWPTTGSWTGGVEVVITGLNLSDPTDMTHVTLAGISVDSIESATATQIVVKAGVAAKAGLGNVVVSSTSFGETVAVDAFEYLREAQTTLVFAPASPQAEHTTNGLSVTGGSGTGAVSFTVASGPGLIAGGTNLVATAGSGTITVVATKAQDGRYYAASATAAVAVVRAAGVYLLDLRHIHDGTAKAASATTLPAGLTVEITYDGSLAAPSDVGDYAVVGTVDDGTYLGTATGTLRILAPWNYQHVDFGDGWCWVGWLGFYAPMSDGWIWHEQHGFFYVPAEELLEDTWMYAMDMGWLWSGDGTYPFIYRRGDGAWLWYSGSVNPRQFYNFTEEDWEERP